MWIFPVRGRYALCATDRKPKSFSLAEMKRCQIIGDYPTLETARAGARRRLANQRKAQQ